MNHVCVKLETVVKQGLSPNSRTSINVQRLITQWGHQIRESSTLENVHMIHKADTKGLNIIKNGMEGLVKIIKDVKVTLEDSVENFSVTTDQYEHVQKVLKSIVKSFKQAFRSKGLLQNSEEEEGEEEKIEKEKIEVKKPKKKPPSGKKRIREDSKKDDAKIKKTKKEQLTLVNTKANRTNIHPEMTDLLGKKLIPTFVHISKHYGNEIPVNAIDNRKHRSTVSNVQTFVQKCPDSLILT